MSTLVRDAILACKGYQQVTGMTTATALTVPDGARYALIQAEAQNVRYRDDGTNPTSTVGMIIPANQDVWYVGRLQALRFIETTTGAILNVSYYG